MKMNALIFKLINPMDHKAKVLELLEQLNPKKDVTQMEARLREMIDIGTYHCFGLFEGNSLIGISSGWTTVRIYCGKHLELDNVIVDSNIQSKGYGSFFLNAIKKWASSENYLAVGLNAYVANARSHKFYYNQGFEVLGFHFEHKLKG